MTKSEATCTVCNAATLQLHPRVSSIFTRQTPTSYRLHHCLICHHIETIPRPTAHQIDEMYMHNYPYQIHDAIASEKRARARQLLSRVLRYSTTGTRLLDLGCGGGELVEVASSLGYQCVGVDIQPSKNTFSGPMFLTANIQEVVSQVPEKKYQVITMSHSLEHQLEPLSILNSIRTNLLADDGILVLVVPNTEAKTRCLFGSKWGYWQVPVHIHHFSSKSLEKFATLTGYRVVYKSFRGADSLFWVLTVMNYFQSSSNEVTKPKIMTVRAISLALSWWKSVGDEDLIYVLTKND